MNSHPQRYLEPFDSVRGYKPRILKIEWRNSFAISKSTSQLLLGAAGKAEIK